MDDNYANRLRWFRQFKGSAKNQEHRLMSRIRNNLVAQYFLD